MHQRNGIKVQQEMTGKELPKNDQNGHLISKATVDSVGKTNFSRKDPSMVHLSEKIKAISQESSWWDLYGLDWAVIIAWELLFFVGVWLLSFPSQALFLCGMLLIGLNYGMIKTKASHLAAHNALCHSKGWAKFWKYFFLEFQGGFSVDAACDIHIKVHHPYTNIIGLGDSSTWRAPFLPCYVYMFFAPLVLPLVTPVVGLGYLVQEKRFVRLMECLCLTVPGFLAQMLVIMYSSGLSALRTLLLIVVSRSVMEIPYLHINIFQHIGLPMYDARDKPPRIRLMATGALNLTRNWLLDWNFGHSLINCHTEHHLFPQLSDNMCLKVKPIVRDYLLKYGLPYNEKDYSERLRYFIANYTDLMVKLPPVTEFAGLQ